MSAGAGIPVAHDDVPVGELTAADDALANRVLVQGDCVPLLDGLELPGRLRGGGQPGASKPTYFCNICVKSIRSVLGSTGELLQSALAFDSSKLRAKHQPLVVPTNFSALALATNANVIHQDMTILWEDGRKLLLESRSSVSVTWR
ncbi:hypothetical protein PG990_014492 [Apiospora arundinis]